MLAIIFFSVLGFLVVLGIAVIICNPGKGNWIN